MNATLWTPEARVDFRLGTMAAPRICAHTAGARCPEPVLFVTVAERSIQWLRKVVLLKCRSLIVQYRFIHPSDGTPVMARSEFIFTAPARVSVYVA
jgi:hypothetical protein